MGQPLALVVATLSQSLGRERYGNERTSFMDDVDRKVRARHPNPHLRGDAMPTAILQRVDDPEPDVPGRPADAARRADVRRQDLAPTTPVVRVRVAAPV